MIRTVLLSSLCGLSIIAPSIAQSYAPYEKATLRTLDKITGRSTDIEVAVDEPIVFGSLTLTMRACFRTPPEEPPESAAFLQIYGQQAKAESEEIDAAEIEETLTSGERLFSGWMYASSPGLSALEHPVYDVWVIRCNAPKPVSGATTPSGTEPDADPSDDN